MCHSNASIDIHQALVTIGLTPREALDCFLRTSMDVVPVRKTRSAVKLPEFLSYEQSLGSRHVWSDLFRMADFYQGILRVRGAHSACSANSRKLRERFS
jgi:hypothetical protein